MSTTDNKKEAKGYKSRLWPPNFQKAEDQMACSHVVELRLLPKEYDYTAGIRACDRLSL